MQILRLVCFLILFCSVLEFNKKFLGCLLDFIFMDCVECLKHLSLNADFGFGVFVFGWIGQVYKVLGLFLLFGLGLKFLQFSWYFKNWNRLLCDFGGKSGELSKGCCSKIEFDGKCSEKMSSCKSGLSKLLMDSDHPRVDKLEEVKNEMRNGDSLANYKLKCVSDEDEQESCDVDKEFDVLALRKKVKIERRRANAARLELDKERMASASSAEEAMAMILRLQNEKSLIEMEAKQYRRLAEEKQLHDQEVIQSLQWLVLKHESERSILEDQLRSCSRVKVKPFGKINEGDHWDGAEESLGSRNNGNLENAFHHALFSSRDMDQSAEQETVWQNHLDSKA